MSCIDIFNEIIKWSSCLLANNVDAVSSEWGESRRKMVMSSRESSVVRCSMKGDDNELLTVYGRVLYFFLHEFRECTHIYNVSGSKIILQLPIEGRKLWNWRDSHGGKLFAWLLLMRASASWPPQGDSISSIEEHGTLKPRLKSKTRVWSMKHFCPILKSQRHHYRLWNCGNMEGVLIWALGEQMSSLIDVF